MNTARAVDDEETAERDLAMLVASFMLYQEHVRSFRGDLARQVRKQVAEDVVFPPRVTWRTLRISAPRRPRLRMMIWSTGFRASTGTSITLRESSPRTISGLPEVVATSQDSTAVTLRRARSSHSSRKSDHNPVADAIAPTCIEGEPEREIRL